MKKEYLSLFNSTEINLKKMVIQEKYLSEPQYFPFLTVSAISLRNFGKSIRNKTLMSMCASQSFCIKFLKNSLFYIIQNISLDVLLTFQMFDYKSNSNSF